MSTVRTETTANPGEPAKDAGVPMTMLEPDVVELDEERKAAMISNLLVVLCSDRATQPVVNTGSLYH